MLIDIHQNSAKVATQWLHGVKFGYTWATQNQGENHGKTEKDGCTRHHASG
jgi:hypothetical protein